MFCKKPGENDAFLCIIVDINCCYLFKVCKLGVLAFWHFWTDLANFSCANVVRWPSYLHFEPAHASFGPETRFLDATFFDGIYINVNLVQYVFLNFSADLRVLPAKNVNGVCYYVCFDAWNVEFGSVIWLGVVFKYLGGGAIWHITIKRVTYLGPATASYGFLHKITCNHWHYTHVEHSGAPGDVFHEIRVCSVVYYG